MNICCLTGEILTNPRYDFFYNSKKHISVIKFNIKTSEMEIGYLKNKSTIIKINAYDENADYVYRFFNKGEFINIIGWINYHMEVNVIEIAKIDTYS